MDAGPEVNSVQELEVNDGQGLDRRQGLEVNGRQERVGDEYAVDGIRLQSYRNTCRHQVYCLQRDICDVCD